MEATGNLFLAIFPGQDTAGYVSELGADLRVSHGLTGWGHPADHLHVTLHWLGEFAGVPDRLVQKVAQACEAVAARVPAVDVTLDHALSFFDQGGNHPLVLMGNDEENTALFKFHQILVLELAKDLRLEKGSMKFNPHLTLLYDKRSVAKTPIEPVCWKAEEIVLVNSLKKTSEYQWLGRWRLGV